MADPILILQMQRMGDLVLTFPLMVWLQRHLPEHPLWVVAEQLFFEGLLNLSPQATFFPWNAAQRLQTRRYRLIINLSHRQEAAMLASSLKAQETIGPVKNQDSPVHILGQWQMYRANLVQNNRHNQFHWADLNALDAVEHQIIARTIWPKPCSKKQGRVGLFLGASQPEKRPTTDFWAKLTANLLHRGLTPVLLGGAAEKKLGRDVAKLAKTPAINLCGRFDVPGFVRSLKQIDLLVTPDTGPMHLAAWMGIPCLNLSMGPVNPWETGPYQPGHFVLQAAMSCVNCWQCDNPVPHRCRQRIAPDKIGYIVQLLARNKPEALGRLELKGMRLLQSSRNRLGLYHLQRLGDAPPSLRELTGSFWTAYFAMLHGIDDQEAVRRAWCDMTNAAPALATPLSRGVQRLFNGLSRSLRTGEQLDKEFWRATPPLLRPLSGYLQMLLQNSDYTLAGNRQALGCLEHLAAVWS